MGHQHGPVTRARAVAVVAGILAVAAAAPPPAPAASVPRLVWRTLERARGVPAADAGSAYFLTTTHELVAVSLLDGRVRWRAALDASSPTFGSAVVLHDDLVIAGDYDLVAVDRRTGLRRWTFSPSDNGGAGMYLGASSGGIVFTGSLAGSLHGVDVDTGQPRFSVLVGDAAETVVYAPVARGPLAAAAFSTFGPTPAGGVVVVDVSRGMIRWKRPVPGSVGASGNVVFAGDVVVAASTDGVLHAFDLDTGATRWSLPAVPRLAELGDQDFRALAVSGRTLVAGSLWGEVVGHDVITRRVLWRRRPVAASVAYTGLTMKGEVAYIPYFSGELVALRVRDGTELWRIGGASLQLRWGPFVDGRRLLVSAGDSLVFLTFNNPILRGRR